MSRDNPIEIIGFQDEKVHTGLLAWLLTTDRFRSPEVHAVLRELFPANAPVEDLRVKEKREAGRGRSRRIDLVLTGSNENYGEWHSVIECKTDSDVRPKQLIGTRNDFQRWSKDTDGSRSRFLVLAVGAGECTYDRVRRARKQVHRAEAEHWTLLGCRDLRALLSPIEKKANDPLLTHWVNALDAEINRADRVVEAFGDDAVKAELGYRRGYDLYYRYYDALRHALNPSDPGTWHIYSGANNPVLNCADSWIPREHSGGLFETYFEFNRQTLYFKASFYGHRARPAGWDAERRQLIDCCQGGKPAKNKRGKHSASLYSWEFDFATEDPETIAKRTNAYIRDVQGSLASLD